MGLSVLFLIGVTFAIATLFAVTFIPLVLILKWLVRKYSLELPEGFLGFIFEISFFGSVVVVMQNFAFFLRILIRH